MRCRSVIRRTARKQQRRQRRQRQLAQRSLLRPHPPGLHPPPGPSHLFQFEFTLRVESVFSLWILQQGFCAQQPAPSLISTTPRPHSLPATTQIMNRSYLLLPPTGNTAPALLQLTQHRRKSQIPLSWVHLFPGGYAPQNRLQHPPFIARIR